MARLSHDLDDEVPVCISINGTALTVAPDPVPISIKGKHRAHWFLRGEGTIDSITFASGNGPFQAGHQVPKSKRHVLSDIVTNPDHLKTKRFKYTVVVITNTGKQIPLDPDVDVMP